MTDIVASSIQKLERDGFCILPHVYTPEQTEIARTKVCEWEKRMDGQLATNVPLLARDTRMVYNLQAKDVYFIAMLLSPPDMQSILMHFLNDPWYKQIPQDEPNYILRSFLARSSSAPLAMHIDSFIPAPGDYPIAVQCLIALEDSTRENGCSIVVPGSHKSGRYAEQQASETAVPVEVSRGDVVMWDSRLWHGALPNKTSGTRWFLIGTFVRWWVKQMFDIPAGIPDEIYQQLTASQKAVLGFCTIPHKDETTGIDLKHGYDVLPDHVRTASQLGS